MRIPGWLMVLFGVGSFAFLTLLCSLLSYSIVRTGVIDAADNGVEVPDVVELIDYVLDPPDAEDAFETVALDTGGEPAAQNPGFQLQPTATPDPSQPTATPGPVDETLEPTATEEQETVASAVTQIPLSQFDPLADVPTWEDPRRINVLLMGVDQRGDEIFEDRFRTDTMIIVQVDPITKTVGVLSIPRDLWVQIPGFESGRINLANYLGDAPDLNLPGGGPTLAMETINANFGVPVQYYVQVNFDVFTTVVDTVAEEGIEICVPQEINDPKYPDAGRGTINITIPAGCQQMDSERLLQYARTRATQGGDFDRNRRQQEVLDAIQRELLSVGGVASMVSKIPELYNQLADSYRTNLSLEQILALARLMSEVESDDITYGTINTLHVTLDTNEAGDQILIPNYNAIRQVISQTFDPQPDLSTADVLARAGNEDATITVLNNTTIAGLAGQTREWLTSQGVTVTSVGNVDPPQNAVETVILDFTGNPWTTRYLAELMGLPQSAVRPGGGSGIQSGSDVVIVIGSEVQSLVGVPSTDS